KSAQRGLEEATTRRPQYHDMRSTGLIVLAARRCMWVGHVGDSRAYLVRDGKARRLTQDDTLVQTLVCMGQLDPLKAKHRSQAHVLLQSLGDPRELEYHVSGAIETRLGDVVVACSDGLSDVLSDREIAALAQGGTSKDIAKRLLEAAIAKDAEDNV